jgi:hypothetical protein
MERRDELQNEELCWTPENVAHIARHGVTPDDVAEVGATSRTSTMQSPAERAL